jgi:hypothetical protein
MHSSSAVLPAPFGPTIAMISPVATSNVTSERTSWLPALAANEATSSRRTGRGAMPQILPLSVRKQQ